MIQDYAKQIQEAIARIQTKENEKLERAATALKTTIRSGAIIHTFGSGHSSLVAADVVGRTGCPVGINQIIDKTEDMAERLNGYGTTLMKHYHQQYQILKEDCLIVISNSGRNPLPIEVALAGQAKGLTTIAISNVTQAKTLPSRHESGKNLSQVADIVLDTHLAIGEAALELPKSKNAVAPLSTFASMFIMQSIILKALEKLELETTDIPVYQSENAALANADEHNAKLRQRYQGRLRRFGV